MRLFNHRLIKNMSHLFANFCHLCKLFAKTTVTLPFKREYGNAALLFVGRKISNAMISQVDSAKELHRLQNKQICCCQIIINVNYQFVLFVVFDRDSLVLQKYMNLIKEKMTCVFLVAFNLRYR